MESTTTTKPSTPRTSSTEEPTSRFSASSSFQALQRLTSVRRQPSTAADPPRHDHRHAKSFNGSDTIDRKRTTSRSYSAGHIPSIIRTLSSLFQSTAVETFRCYICFDDAPVINATTLSTCGHRFCQACFTSYLSIKISEGNIRPVCFHPVETTSPVSEDLENPNPASAMHRTCSMAVSVEQIEANVDAEVWAKFTRFRFTAEHKHARECPYCAFSQECEGAAQPSCVCVECGKLFCFFHGNAHEDGTCADYELRNAETEALNRALINELAKPCPGCAQDIEKNGGCNHMKCVACGTSFCWLCGEVIEDTATPAHFDVSNGGGCSGQLFDPGDVVDPLPRWAYVIALLFFPVMFLVAVLSVPFVWCRARDEHFSAVFWRVHDVLQYTIAYIIAVVGLLLKTLVDFAIILVTVSCELFISALDIAATSLLRAIAR